ncbi:MAG: hypothetical protein A2Y81_12715 [Nitrospirae bacterium RBG_13_43_8]|nr:MAG: hypothetical protein A2Y81_12715 [Nitrospirae bacterium RBG_13_43_8]
MDKGRRKAHRLTSPVSQRLYTLLDAAAYLGRTEWGMRELLWQGEIPVVMAEKGRKIFVDKLDLDSFIERNKRVYEP